jgi:hypothetical protein
VRVGVADAKFSIQKQFLAALLVGCLAVGRVAGQIGSERSLVGLNFMPACGGLGNSCAD